MQGIWSSEAGHIPCRFLTMAGEVGVYLGTKGTSMCAKHASSASLLYSVPCPRMTLNQHRARLAAARSCGLLGQRFVGCISFRLLNHE
jgi:hypothetical protein